MRTALGIDVGSTTAKAVVLAEDGSLLRHACRRHRGRPIEVTREVIEAVRQEDEPLRGITGSLGVALAGDLRAVTAHEVHAVALATRARAPHVRTVIELGGQDAKILAMDPAGDHHAEMNDRCAAGTGATLDRIAHRLGLGPAELSDLRLEGDLRVASRCGVFAETDVVNLVKRGASRAEAMGALARAIVAQNLAVLARGRVLRTPALLLGGPHAHLPVLAEAWIEALGEAEVPSHAELFAAIGAALHVLRDGRPHPTLRGISSGSRVDPPLVRDERDRALLRRLFVDEAPDEGDPTRGALALGIDAGSTTSKAVFLDRAGRIVARSYAASAGDPVADAIARVEELHAKVPDARVGAVGVTGYGADLVGPALGADWTGVETLAHASAAAFHAPGVEVVVDVGGTDVKVLLLDGDRLSGFHVSNQCSAGHGAFLAAAASDMHIPLDTYAERALLASRMPRFTVGCGIFVDTDRVTFQRDGFSADEILAGLAWALARNVFEEILPEPVERLGRSFLLTGGTMRNRAAAFALARYLVGRIPEARVAVHPHPELGGAIGAALAATPAARTSFVGLDAMRSVRTRVQSGEALRCGRCELACPRTIVTLDRGPTEPERTLVVGNACERGADPGSTGQRTRAHAPDLLAEEALRLFRPLLPRFASASRPTPIFGIPRVMGMYRSAPLVLHYLRAVGVPDDHVVISPPTSELLAGDGAIAHGVHDPCFPSKIVLTHVEWLLERGIDVLLLPAITHARIAVRGTADTASCPIVAASGHTAIAALRRDGDRLGALGVRALAPELCLVDRARLERQLHEAFGPLLGLGAAESRAAVEHAVRAQEAYHDRCRRRGGKVLDRARREGKAVAVMLARPYHADPGVQHGISTELAARGVPVLSIASMPIDESSLDISDILPDITNSGCAEKVWAARRIAADPNLLAVDLSSFRCGQDASILGLLGEILEGAGKPVLRIHDLDEDRPAASLSLRIRSFVATARRYARESLERRPAHARAVLGERRA